MTRRKRGLDVGIEEFNTELLGMLHEASWPDLRIERVCEPSAAVRDLIGELDAVLAVEYREEQQHGLTLDALFAPHVRFFIASVKGAAVGCGGVAYYNGYAELKRMYVRASARGGGAARQLLRRIEQEVLAESCGLLRLETGNRQFAAIRFYEREGFALCEAFGSYAEMAHTAVETSLFFEKRL